MEEIDIVSIVNNNHLTKLSSDYGSKVVEKIRQNFKDYDQQLFVANFYCYLNYDTRKDFVVDMEKIWKWLDFDKKGNCRTLLVNNFIKNIDYIIDNEISTEHNNKFDEKGFSACEEKPNTDISSINLFNSVEKNTKQKNKGGRPVNKILLTVNCFKKLCLRAKTKKSSEIHEYYITMEELLNEIIMEQSYELQIKLRNKDKENTKNMIDIFKNKQVVYLIQVEENIIKFGQTMDIKQRMKDHTKEFGDQISLKFVIETNYDREFEKMIKTKVKKYLISKTYKTNQTELVKLDKTFTYDKLRKYIDEIKDYIDGNLMLKLIEENTQLKIKITQLENNSIYDPKLVKENQELKEKIVKLEEKNKELSNINISIEEEKLKLRKYEIDLRQQKFQNRMTSSKSHRIENGIEQKFCRGILCREETYDGKWISIDNFSKTSKNKDGLRGECKDCINVVGRHAYSGKNNKMTEEELKQSKYNKSLKTRVKIIDGKKKCTHCNTLKELNEYSINGKYINGDIKYKYCCKLCENKKKKEKRESHKVS